MRSVLAFLLPLFWCPLLFAQTSETRVYQKILNHSVWIVIERKEDKGIESAMGVLIDKERKLVCTSFRPVDGETEAVVLFPSFGGDGVPICDKFENRKRLRGNEGYRAKVLFGDKRRDLSVLEIVDDKVLPKTIQQATVNFEPPLKGDKALSITDVSGDHIWVYLPGKVLQTGNERWRAYLAPKDLVELNARVFDAYLPTGGSPVMGSPAFNERGDLIGILHGYHLPTNAVRHVDRHIHIAELKALCDEKKLKVDWKLPEKDLEVLPVPKNWKEREQAADAILKWVVAWNTIKFDGTLLCFSTNTSFEEHITFRMEFEEKRKRKGDADPEVAAMRDRIEKLQTLMVDRSPGAKPLPQLTPAGSYLEYMRLRLEGERNYSNTLRLTLVKDRDTLARMQADPAHAEKIGFPLSEVELESIVFQNQRKQYARYWSLIKVQISLGLLEAVRILEEAR